MFAPTTKPQQSTNTITRITTEGTRESRVHLATTAAELIQI
jgi:hypothetical protein